MTFRLEFNSDLPAFPPILSKETIFKIPESLLVYSVSQMVTQWNIRPWNTHMESGL